MAATQTSTYAVLAGGFIRQLPCNECGRATNHEVKTGVRREYEWSDGQNYMQATDDTMVVQCRGCDTVAVYCESTNTEDQDFETGEYYVTAIHYPARNIHKARFEQYHLPIGLQGIYVETLKAINEGQPILAAVGIRAMIEAICAEQKMDGRTLFEQINQLRNQNLVTPVGADCLHMIRTAGNSAAHKVKRHSSEQLLVAMRVVENIIEATYQLADAVEDAFVTKPAREAESRKRMDKAFLPVISPDDIPKVDSEAPEV